METTTTLEPLPRRGAARTAATLFLLVALVCSVLTVGAGPADAARRIDYPAGFVCGHRSIGVSPPRIWASHGTEQVGWGNQVERWDAVNRRWVRFQTYMNFASFNYYGQGVTYWIGNPPTPYGSFVNSRLWLQVNQPGYYRVASSIAGSQGGTTWVGYLANGGYCYVS